MLDDDGALPLLTPLLPFLGLALLLCFCFAKSNFPASASTLPPPLCSIKVRNEERKWFISCCNLVFSVKRNVFSERRVSMSCLDRDGVALLLAVAPTLVEFKNEPEVVLAFSKLMEERQLELRLEVILLKLALEDLERQLELRLEMKLELTLEDLVFMLEVMVVARLLLSQKSTVLLGSISLFLSAKTVYNSCSTSCFSSLQSFSFMYNSSLAEDSIANCIFRSIMV